jgi:hypothetical protein
VVLDDRDQANALGYHDLSAERPPVDRILAAGDLKAGTPSTFTGSTEPREMLGGPNINLTGLVENSNTAGVLYAYEVCDSCEDDSGAIRSTMGWFRISPALPGSRVSPMPARFVCKGDLKYRLHQELEGSEFGCTSSSIAHAAARAE